MMVLERAKPAKMLEKRQWFRAGKNKKNPAKMRG